MLTYCELNPWDPYQLSLHQNIYFSFNGINIKISTAKFRPIYIQLTTLATVRKLILPGENGHDKTNPKYGSIFVNVNILVLTDSLLDIIQRARIYDEPSFV